MILIAIFYCRMGIQVFLWSIPPHSLLSILHSEKMRLLILHFKKYIPVPGLPLSSYFRPYILFKKRQVRTPCKSRLFVLSVI